MQNQVVLSKKSQTEQKASGGEAPPEAKQG
jgi:hypothetical protein